jgi:hypothetical protein
MTADEVTQLPWFSLLDQAVQKLLILSLELLEREKKLSSNFPDYAFILFPIGKAYEGFLKGFLLRFGLITEKVYLGRKFRIGRALNPDISPNQRDQWWLYDDVSRQCGDELARKIWNAWILGRNHVFHFFPEEKNTYTLQQVETKINLLLEVFEDAWQCELQKKGPR